MPTNAEYAARFKILRADLLTRYDGPPPDGDPPASAPDMPRALVTELQTIGNVIYQYGVEHDLSTDESLKELSNFTAYLAEGVPAGCRNGPIHAALLAVRDDLL